MKTTLAARHPEDLYHHFAAALNTGDLESVVTLFEPEGQTVPQPGQQSVTGLLAIRSVMQQCLALKPHLMYEATSSLQADDIALLFGQWRLTGRGADGTPIEVTGKGVQVARRQPDGTWRYLIDHPWGAS
jgi:uncharacterized protein (TIGR02246 family)